MNLKNYTSTVPVINSVNRIEYRLVQAGATHIAKSYENEKPTGIIFQLILNEAPITFKLPAKIEKVIKYMRDQRSKPPTKQQLETLAMQAERTAWKILSDWVDIQVSLIQLEQAEASEVFFPYLYDGKTNETLFEKVKSGSLNLLNEWRG